MPYKAISVSLYLIWFSMIVKSGSNLFLEQTCGTQQSLSFCNETYSLHTKVFVQNVYMY